jgi:hypothetical protein
MNNNNNKYVLRVATHGQEARECRAKFAGNLLGE